MIKRFFIFTFNIVKKIYDIIVATIKWSYNFFSFIIKRVNETKLFDAAAAITYYALLSFFPFISLLIALSTISLQNIKTQTKIVQVIQWIQQYFPDSDLITLDNFKQYVINYIHESLNISTEAIHTVINGLLNTSSAGGYIGIIMLIWSASLVFAGFTQHLNAAWKNAGSRNFMLDRFIGIIMIGVLFIGLWILFFTNIFLDSLPKLYYKYATKISHIGFQNPAKRVEFWSGIFTLVNFWSIYSVYVLDNFHKILIELCSYLKFLPITFTFLALIPLYKFIPNCEVKWREAISTGIITGFALLIAKEAFIKYIKWANTSYTNIYGQLGSIVGIMLWIYISSSTILIGGHISAALAHFYRPRDMMKEKLINNEICFTITNPHCILFRYRPQNIKNLI